MALDSLNLKQDSLFQDTVFLYTTDSLVADSPDSLFIEPIDSTIQMFTQPNELSYNDDSFSLKTFSDYTGLLVILCLTLIAFARYLAPRKMANLFKSVNPFKPRNLQLAEHEALSGAPFILLIIFSILSFALALVEINLSLDVFSLNNSGALIYEALFIGLILIYLLYKIIFVIGSSILFKQPDSAELYFRHTFNHLLAMSVIIFPFTVLLHYTNSSFFLYSLMVLSFLFFLMNVIDSYIIGLRSSKISHFYNILYLCMLEIAPLLWLYTFI